MTQTTVSTEFILLANNFPFEVSKLNMRKVIIIWSSQNNKVTRENKPLEILLFSCICAINSYRAVEGSWLPGFSLHPVLRPLDTRAVSRIYLKVALKGAAHNI